MLEERKVDETTRTQFRSILDNAGQDIEGILTCPSLTDYSREILFREIYPEFYPQWTKLKALRDGIPSKIQCLT